jgi:hypothetical protein
VLKTVDVVRLGSLLRGTDVEQIKKAEQPGILGGLPWDHLFLPSTYPPEDVCF